MSKTQELLNNFYDIDNLVTINITIPAQDWQALMHAEPRGGRCNFGYVGDRFDWYKASSVTVSGTKLPQSGTFADVGIIKKSYCGSFSTTKPSLRLDFARTVPANENAAEKLIGTKTLTLNNSTQDPAYIRQPLGYELFRQAGLPYARCNFAKVIVNGTSMGVYVNLEPYKKQFLKNLFAGNDKGNLYELEVGEDLDPAIVASGKISFESGVASDEKDLVIAASQIATGGLAAAKRVIDYDQFVQFFAMETLLKHWDGFTINTNNTYMYNDVVAVANPDISNVKLKFIPCGIDQILQEGRNFEIGGGAILARLVRDDAGGKADLLSAIRTLATTLFSRASHDTILKPYIDRMEALLSTATGGAAPTSDINTVRTQLQLVRSGAFQLLGAFPAEPTTFLNRSAGDCFHASNTEFIPPNNSNNNNIPQPNAPQVVYHYQPTAVPADAWTALPTAAPKTPRTFTLRNQAYGSWLHADAQVKTASGKLNVYAARSGGGDADDDDDGNHFAVEPSSNFGGDPYRKTGYFRLRSKATGNYVCFSDADRTPNGKMQVCQVADSAQAAVLYIF